jgi:GNAT superfamily N-acetyltransferase
MPIVLDTPDVDGLGRVAQSLREWQYDGAPMQLHPGDLGWFWRFGALATAASVRTWSRDGRTVAVGLLDEADLLRMTIAPDAHRDEELARRVAADVADPARGVLPGGEVSIEAPPGVLLQDVLAAAGWKTGEPWTPLRRDLTAAVEVPDLRIEVIGAERVDERVAVQRASFDRSTFSEEKWLAMVAGGPYADARCLLAYNDAGEAVAAVTVWSAGPGRPGLLEPMGVKRDHRGHGYGRAISTAAASALRDLGSSQALVATQSANIGAVATYLSAGFQPQPVTRDRIRDS